MPKGLQQRLLGAYLGQLAIHPTAKAFHPGASTVGHTFPHAPSVQIATIDLRDFFESSTGRRLRGLFLAVGWRGEASGILMRLCTYRDGLPQGAPTGPCRSNLVNRARRSGGVDTRYADDLDFSWPGGPMPGSYPRKMESILEREGYCVQLRKGWRIGLNDQRPESTGMILAGDGRLHVPWRYRLRTAWLRWRSFWTEGPLAIARRRGREGYRRMVVEARSPRRGKPGGAG